MADRFQTSREPWLPPPGPGVEGGEGFLANGKLQIKPPAVPRVASEGRAKDRGLELTADRSVAGPTCASGVSCEP